MHDGIYHNGLLTNLVLQLLELPLLFFSHVFCRRDIEVAEVSAIFNSAIVMHSVIKQKQRQLVLSVQQLVTSVLL